MSRKGNRYRNVEERLLVRSAVLADGCWLWLGKPEKNGYCKVGIYEGGGRANEKVRQHWVHRLAYQTFTGPIPVGHDVDHKCRQPLCINPNHLQAVPASKNRSNTWSKNR